MATDNLTLGDRIISNMLVLIDLVTASPNPTYTVGGKTFNKAEYLQALSQELENMRLSRQRDDGYFEVVTRCYT